MVLTPPLLAPDQFAPVLGPGRAVGVQQRFDRLAALGLLAMLGLVGRPKRPHPLAEAQGRVAVVGRDHVDQVGIDHHGQLGLGVRLGGQRRLVVFEQVGVGEPGHPAVAAGEDGLAVVEPIAGQRLHDCTRAAARSAISPGTMGDGTARAATSPMISSAGPSRPWTASLNWPSVLRMRRSLATLAFSTTSTGAEADRPAPTSRAAMPGGVERPI